MDGHQCLKEPAIILSTIKMGVTLTLVDLQ